MAEKKQCNNCEAVESATLTLIEELSMMWCRECLNEQTFKCQDCDGREMRTDEFSVENGNKTVCQSCYDDYHECNQCSEMHHDDNMHYCESCEVNYCSNCTCECDNESGIRHINPREDSTLYLTSEHGTRIRATAKIGVEIECNNFVHGERLELPRHVGVVGDGSIGYSGVEIVTPPAQGVAAEKLITDVCKALKIAGAKVNADCGLHVHIDGTLLHDDLQATKRLMQLYVTFEEVIMSFLPTSRRRNQYSNPLAEYFSIDELQRVATFSQLEKMWYRVETQQQANRLKEDKYNHTRYRGLNMHSYFKSGHFEIRYHSGTTDADKIINWCALHITMLERAKNGRYDLHGVIGEPSLKYKTDRLFMVLGLPKSIEEFYLNRQKLFARENPKVNENAIAELYEQAIVTPTEINISS